MPLYLFFTMVQKSQKWPKTQIKGGSCLKACVTVGHIIGKSLRDEPNWQKSWKKEQNVDLSSA